MKLARGGGSHLHPPSHTSLIGRVIRMATIQITSCDNVTTTMNNTDRDNGENHYEATDLDKQ